MSGVGREYGAEAVLDWTETKSRFSLSIGGLG